MRSFYVTLPSNVKLSNGENTLAHFKTMLPQRIALDGKWCVGLAEVSYTNSWFNIREDMWVRLLDDEGVSLGGVHAVTSGHYENEEQLLAAVEKAVQKLTPTTCWGKDEPQTTTRRYPRLDLDKRSRTAKLVPGTDESNRKVYLDLDPRLQEILGLDTKRKELSDTVKGEEDAFQKYDLKAGIHSLFVYCSLLDPVIVGDALVPLLRTVQVPKRQKFGEQIVVTYEKPHYIPLAHTDFDSIEVKIADDNGRLIPFKFGRTILTLHFKQYEPLR